VVSKARVRELLQHGGHYKHEQLSAGSMAPVYVLPNGSALLVWPESGRGRLYESLEDLLAINEAARQAVARGPINMVRELLPQGDQFLNKLPKLLDELPLRLSIDKALLDGSLESLDLIDSKIRNSGSKLLKPEGSGRRRPMPVK